MDVRKRNLEALRLHHPIIYEDIKSVAHPSEYEVIPSRQGCPTVKVGTFFLHSRYNPIQEAKKFIDAQWDYNQEEIVLYGFGFGYHVAEALDRIQPKQKLYVFELNIAIFNLALTHVDITHILAHPQLTLVVSEDQAYIAGRLHELVTRTNRLLVYPPSARAIPEQYERLKFLLEVWDKRLLQVQNYIPLLQENYKANNKRNDPNVSEFFGRYRGKPIIVVSSGPSLNKNKQLLQQCKGKALLIAAGSALRPILAAGVEPDMFCIIDAIYHTTRKQIEGVENLDIPLIYLETASSGTVEAYQGPRFIAVNSERPGVGRDELIESGGSVATAVLDIAIRMGGNPIIFVGQDLAFTNQEHHADGRMYGEEEKVKIDPTMRQVRGQNGELLWTNIGLLGYKYWIEERIQREKNVIFINATEGGASIDGCIHMPLVDAIAAYINK